MRANAKIKCICHWCGKEVYRYPSQVIGKSMIFCSRQCLADYRSKAHNPTGRPITRHPHLSEYNREHNPGRMTDAVREKNSYAYYINSINKSYDNIMIIFSGIEPNTTDKVLDIIKKKLINITKGEFDKNNLENSKETIISGIKAAKDSPSGIINTYFAKELVGSGDFEERIENIKKITTNDIINISKKIKIHSIYTLESEDSNESN